MATPTNFKPLSALSERAPSLSDYAYLTDNAGLLEGKSLLSAMLALASSKTYTRLSVPAVLSAGQAYTISGGSTRTLPEILVGEVSITIVRNDDANDFILTPHPGGTVAGDPSLTVDVNGKEFVLVANLADNNWEVVT